MTGADLFGNARRRGRCRPAIRELELNALVPVVEITDDADAAIADLREQIPDVDPAELRELPDVLVGTVDEIVEQLHRCRDRWGISYFAVRTIDAFAPVIAAANR